ncbi:hypothetical protein BGZ96_011394 [Linnemannia gamsii]|uniref:Glutaredoxin domain-containing protein n=1 Tax=Linnemannia gamsii TaxID=64522 RepID=A0ABQ7KFS1_9FUNG|nr:hypothetical protein BGZ96_011394 [Linnemannia gamsii]
MAERLLKARGVEHIEKIAIDKDPAQRDEMIQRTGLRTVPQIFIDGTHIGGYDKLAALDRNESFDLNCNCKEYDGNRSPDD